MHVPTVWHAWNFQQETLHCIILLIFVPPTVELMCFEVEDATRNSDPLKKLSEYHNKCEA